MEGYRRIRDALSRQIALELRFPTRLLEMATPHK